MSLLLWLFFTLLLLFAVCGTPYLLDTFLYSSAYSLLLFLLRFFQSSQRGSLNVPHKSDSRSSKLRDDSFSSSSSYVEVICIDVLP